MAFNKKKMLKQVRAVRKVRARATKLIKKRIDKCFVKLADSIDEYRLFPDYYTFEKEFKKVLKLTHQVVVKNTLNAMDEMYKLSNNEFFPKIQDKILNDFNVKKAGEKVVKVTNTTKKQINDIIKTRQAEGVSAKQISRELKQKVNGMTKHRSLTIARTETANANGFAMNELAKETLVNTKYWVHVGGGATHREEHVGMDTEERKITEAFSNGMMYAHEDGAPAGEVINCYCITTYEFKVPT